MNFKKNNILILAIFMLFLSSCEEAYDKSSIVDSFESRLVVNSFFSATAPWSVSVSKSGNIIDKNNNLERVTDATVEIYNSKGKFLYELFHTEDGFYSHGNYTPSVGQEYTIKVECKNFKDVVAKSRVPGETKLSINNFNPVIVEDEKGVEVDFKIENTSKAKSFYLWEVVQLDATSLFFEDTKRETDFSRGFLNSLDKNDISPKLGNNIEIVGTSKFENGTYITKYNSVINGRSGSRDLDNRGGRKPIVDDILMVIPNNISQGKVGTGDIPNLNYEEEVDIDSKNEIVYELRVLSISEELYDYYNSVDTYIKTGQSPSTLNTPYTFYSNIHNGLGVFAGYTETIVRF